MAIPILFIIYAVLSIGVLVGITLMSKVEKAVLGNLISAFCMLLAIVVTIASLKFANPKSNTVLVFIGLGIGALIGIIFTFKVTMIAMPQTVALLNGLGGAASAIAALLTIQKMNALFPGVTTTVSVYYFSLISALIALAVGAITFSGSLVAAAKLNKMLPQKQIVLPMHQVFTLVLALGMLALIVMTAFDFFAKANMLKIAITLIMLSLVFGVVFAIRVGGADMPITISLLNSTSGVAAAIAGLAISDILLIAIGGIVGASGLILTQIMCKAMNRHLSSIIFAKSSGKKASTKHVSSSENGANDSSADLTTEKSAEEEIKAWLSEANDIIIIPGYGMALSQAQGLVKQLSDKLENMGKTVRFAIHPVAGRMPGHMNVLLAEVDLPYDKLYEMDAINDDFAKADLAIVIGASDVINPAANTAEGTPIYGMPILKAGEAKRLIICNFDRKPGYAGVPNPLYESKVNIKLLLGDAKDSLAKIIASF